MSGSRIVLALLTAMLVLPGDAAAAGGNGLYEPFPRPAARQAASAFARRAALRLPAAALGRGTFVGAAGVELSRSASLGPEVRAGRGASTTGVLWPMAGAVALGVFFSLLLTMRRRHPGT